MRERDQSLFIAYGWKVFFLGGGGGGGGGSTGFKEKRSGISRQQSIKGRGTIGN